MANVCIYVYRSPTGNWNFFFNLLVNILNKFVQPNVTFKIYVNLYINLLAKSNAASKPLTLMNTYHLYISLIHITYTYHLSQVVDFPARRNNNEGTLIDVIFVHTRIYDQIQIKPFINGLSVHDAQFIDLHKIDLISQQKFSKRKLRIINSKTSSHFLSLLNEESWNQICNASCINEIFNTFHDTLLRHYDAIFPAVYVNVGRTLNNWITKGIKISCIKKRELFFFKYRENKNNLQLKNHYKKYGQILKKVINEVKKQYFYKQVSNYK